MQQGFDGHLDSSLSTLFSKATVPRGNGSVLVIGDKEVEFNPEFCLFMQTSLGEYL
jgi:hypothetical protein